MDNFGLQLYTIRNELSGDEAARAMKRVKELGYSYVQVAGSLAAIERTGLMAREIGLEVIGSVGFIEYILADFDEAVKRAAKAAVKGDVVLMSPASASFDRFKNFMERGDHFKKLVEEL